MPLESIAGRLTLYQVGFTDGKFQIWRQTEKGKSLLPLVSPRNPDREAERMLAGFRLRKGLLAIVTGVSQIPLLSELSRHRQILGGEILVLEADSLLHTSLSAIFPDIFENVTVITPDNVTAVSSYAEELDIETLTGYRIFSPPSVVSVDSLYYEKLIAEIKQKFSSRFSDLFTRLEFEPGWILNSLINLSLVQKARPTSSLFGQGKGYKALIVSTGPSLRQSIPWIKINRHKFFIACADSAYRVLHRQGLTPDLVFSLDSQAYTLRHFLGLPQGATNALPALACDFVSNPQVTLRWNGPLLFSFTAQFLGNRRVVTPGCDFLEEQKFFDLQNNTIPGDVQSGGSVATSLFDLLRQMEFSEIWFIGQDLAYTNHEIHTTGTHHTDIWMSKNLNRLNSLENLNYAVTRKRHIKYENSLKGRLIPGDYVLSLYRSWFADAAGRVTIKLFNATAEGLPIDHIPHMDIQKEKTVTGADFPREEWFKKILDRPGFTCEGEAIKSFYEECSSPEFKGDKFSFMELIGRKYDLRNKSDQDFADKKKREKSLFIAKLKRKTASLKNSIQ